MGLERREEMNTTHTLYSLRKFEDLVKGGLFFETSPEGIVLKQGRFIQVKKGTVLCGTYYANKELRWYPEKCIVEHYCTMEHLMKLLDLKYLASDENYYEYIYKLIIRCHAIRVVVLSLPPKGLPYRQKSILGLVKDLTESSMVTVETLPRLNAELNQCCMLSDIQYAPESKLIMVSNPEMTFVGNVSEHNGIFYHPTKPITIELDTEIVSMVAQRMRPIRGERDHGFFLTATLYYELVIPN